MNVDGQILLLALLGALGVFFVFNAIFRPIKLPRSRLAMDLEELEVGVDAERRRRLSIFAERSSLDRLLTPFLWRAATALDSVFKGQDRYAQMIVQAQYSRYQTVGDVYARKIIYMVLLTALTAASVWVLRKPMWAPLIPVMFVLGFFLPDLELRQAIAGRRRAILMEMGFALDRVLIYRASGETLAMAIVNVAATPGGPFVGELRRVATEWQATAQLIPAVEKMCQRNQIPELDRFAAVVMFVEEQGAQAGPAIRALSDSIKKQIAIQRERQARQNETLMIFPALLLVIPMLMAIILLPAVPVIMSMF